MTIKRPPNDVLLIQSISALVNPHQRSIFFQWMGINTEAHNWTMCREWEIWEHSILNGILSSKPFHQGSGIYVEEEMDQKKSPRWWMTPRKVGFPLSNNVVHSDPSTLGVFPSFRVLFSIFHPWHFVSLLESFSFFVKFSLGYAFIMWAL